MLLSFDFVALNLLLVIYCDFLFLLFDDVVAIDMAFRRGVVVVMSVGNYGERSLATPADAKGALAVGSVNVNVVRSYFSSVGPTADGTSPETIFLITLRAYQT